MTSLDTVRGDLSLVVLYLSKAEARDKICRAIQYGSKFLSNGEPGPARLLSLDQGIQGARFSTEGIRNNIGLSGMVMDPDVIILNEFHPTSLPQVQLLLGEDILQALVISIDPAAMTHKIGSPRF